MAMNPFLRSLRLQRGRETLVVHSPDAADDGYGGVLLAPGDVAAARLRVACVAVSFRAGLVASAPAIRRTDVLVGPHGADMTNALGMHAGASVLEVIPVHTRGCPCDKFRQVFGMEPRTLHHYTAQSRNASYATSTTRPLAGTYNSDLYLPPAVLEAEAALRRARAF